MSRRQDETKIIMGQEKTVQNKKLSKRLKRLAMLKGTRHYAPISDLSFTFHCDCLDLSTDF